MSFLRGFAVGQNLQSRAVAHADLRRGDAGAVAHGAGLVVEATLPNRVAGLAHPGRDVEVKIETLPRYCLPRGLMVDASDTVPTNAASRTMMA